MLGSATRKKNMKDESGSSESVAVIAVFVCLVLAALFYAVIILVKLLLWGLLIAAIGVAVYFLIKQTGASRQIDVQGQSTFIPNSAIESETTVGRRIDGDLLEILARVEKLEPVRWSTNTSHWSSGRDEGWNYPGLFSGEVQTNYDLEYQEWVLKDTGPWGISMMFVQDTPDGNLKTIVRSEADLAWVTVTVGGYHLGGLSYSSINRAAVQYVREWVRRRVLPEFEAAKVWRDSSSDLYKAHLDAMRKKYLP